MVGEVFGLQVALVINQDMNNEYKVTHLPKSIRRTLDERRGYHHRFFVMLIVVSALFFFVFVAIFWSLLSGDLKREEIGVQAFLVTLYSIFFAVPMYFVFYHRKRRQVLDDCLKNQVFSVVNGTLDGIQRLHWKRVRYVIDGRPIEGNLTFLGFKAFQNTRIVEVVSWGQLPIQLYLLPSGLIAGAVYPGSDTTEPVNRLVNTDDLRVIAQGLSGKLNLYAIVSLTISLLVVCTCWFIEWKLGWGWEHLGGMLAAFNGVLLLLMATHALVSWPEIRAWLNRHDPSMYIETYQGTATEWYLTSTRYGGNSTATSIFDGWVRLSGGLHHIQHDISATDRGLLEPLQIPVKVEYLVHKGRLIFLSSTSMNQL